MKSFKSRFKGAFLAAFAAIAIAAACIPVPSAQAATPNYSANNVSVVAIPFHVSGQYTTTTAAIIRFALPFKGKLVGVGASARASGGTTPTLTVDVKAGGVTVLSAPFAVTAGAYSEGTISVPNIADEAAITVDFTIGGTTPTWNDMVVFLTFVRT
jgi:hypothetical protein